MDNEFAIEIRQLDLRLHEKVILSDISFSVQNGEYLAIVGPNGAGKTSLLRCVIRALSGWSGWIRVLGKATRVMNQKELARKMAYVPQAGFGVAAYTVRQFLLMSRYPYLNPFSTVTQMDHDIVMGAMADTGIGPLAERTLSTLSGGERQKAMTAAALVQQSPIMMLDEPSTFLDPRHEADIRRILAGANMSGRTIVEVTHDLNAAAMAADRILALKDGRVAFLGDPTAFMDEHVLSDIFDHSFLLAPHPHTGDLFIMPDAAGVSGRGM